MLFKHVHLYIRPTGEELEEMRPVLFEIDTSKMSLTSLSCHYSRIVPASQAKVVLHRFRSIDVSGGEITEKQFII
jgi:hypothetical protein